MRQSGALDVVPRSLDGYIVDDDVGVMVELQIGGWKGGQTD